MLEILGLIGLGYRDIMDIRKFRGFDPKAKILLIGVVAVIGYGIGNFLNLGLVLGAAACAAAYWAFFGFGGD